MKNIDQRLAELRVTLPEAPQPAANYIPFVKCGNLVFVSGQVSIGIDGPIKGKLGQDMEISQGAQAARVCAINLLSQIKIACEGNLDRVVRVVKLTGFVNSTPNFQEHPNVINGASDFLVEVFGENGRHSRSAIGVAALPFNFAVEVEGIFEIRPD